MSQNSLPKDVLTVFDRPLGIGVLAGLSAAVLLIAATGGSPFGFLLLTLIPLPLYIAGHGWGAVSAGVSALVGTLTVFLTASPLAAFVFILGVGVAPVILTYKAALRRPLPGGAGEEWYPPGRLLTLLIGLAAVLFLFALLAFLAVPGGLEGAMQRLLEPQRGQILALSQYLANVPALSSEQQVFALLVRTIPAAAAIFWVMIHAGAFVIGLHLARLSGRTVRPPIPLDQVEIPAPLSLALALSFALALAPGGIGFMGTTLAAIFATPFMITGVMTVHMVTERWAVRLAQGGGLGLAIGLRTVFLILFYVLLLQGLALAVILLGLADLAFGFRRNAPVLNLEGD